jgi:hypothetical protein
MISLYRLLQAALPQHTLHRGHARPAREDLSGPIGPLSANDSAEREEIFAAHEFMAEAGNELEYEEGSGSGEN